MDVKPLEVFRLTDDYQQCGAEAPLYQKLVSVRLPDNNEIRPCALAVQAEVLGNGSIGFVPRLMARKAQIITVNPCEQVVLFEDIPI